MDEQNQPVLEVPVSGSPEPPSLGPRSPRWGSTTKLVVGLSLVAISAYLLFKFLNIVGPLLLAFILAYLFHPVSATVRDGLRLSWRAAVTLLYLMLFILVIGLIAIGGLAVVDQVQSLIQFLENAVKDLPAFITEFTTRPLVIGPFVLNLQLLDVNALTQQILGAVQPLLSRAGSSVVTVATSAASFIGWLFFILLISYFILAESGGIPYRLFSLNIPGYADDFQQLGSALSRIWNAFLRGQIYIVLLTIFVYTILLGGLGVNYFFGLALLAGLARFIPYVGPFVAWTTYGLVAFFQAETMFGLPPLGYAALVVGIAWATDSIMDNLVVPRMMSNALRVHPAAVMVSALVAFNLLGVIGLVLAAPVLASVKLILEYIMAKLFDQDPWAKMDLMPAEAPPSLPPLFQTIQERFERMLYKTGLREKMVRPGARTPERRDNKGQ